MAHKILVVDDEEIVLNGSHHMRTCQLLKQEQKHLNIVVPM